MKNAWQNGNGKFVKIDTKTLAIVFFERLPITLLDSSGNTHAGVILSLQHEDGSGRSFNVTLDSNTFHVRTID